MTLTAKSDQCKQLINHINGYSKHSLLGKELLIKSSTRSRDSEPRPTAATPSTLILAIIRSSIPCLLFLVVYGLNGRIRLMPRASDTSGLNLYNISAIETRLLQFSPQQTISFYHNLALDILSAIPYLLHYTIPVIYPLWLYWVGRSDLIPQFYKLLGAVMWVVYFIWYFVPTAPPWVWDNAKYYQLHQISPPPTQLQPREGCAFSRLDQRSGVAFFHAIFAGNPVPYASFPSGHVAWPVCIAVTLPRRQSPSLATSLMGRLCRYDLSIPAAVCYIMWVSWATMYSCHHYLIDILAAVMVVLVTDKLFTYLSIPNWRIFDTCLVWLQRRLTFKCEDCRLTSVSIK